MKIYRVEMMDRASYHEFMCGGYNYRVRYYDVEAESTEQALAIAKQDNPSYCFNEGFVREVAKREYTVNERDIIRVRIADLERELEELKNDLRNLENRG